MKITDNKKYLMIGVVLIVVILSSVFLYDNWQGTTQRITKAEAPDFRAIDENGESFSLSDFQGEVVILHITNIENPICLECEKELRAQTEELDKLSEYHNDTTIITINMRTNPYSDDGKSLAEEWWGINITWHWVEDFQPYPIATKYTDYWNLKGGAVNPTILLIDQEQMIVGVYHVYQMGEGQIDGIQDADTLSNKAEKIEQGTWEGFEGEISQQKFTFLGMFALGIITSLSPCSVALIIAMFSFIMTSSGKESQMTDGEKSYSKEGFVIGVAFTLGMALVFFVVGLFISSIGEFVRASALFYLIAGFVMILLGINNIKPISEMLGPLRGVIGRYRKPKDTDCILDRGGFSSVSLFKKSIIIGAFFLGIFFALAWAPCAVSLVFPVLIWMMSQETSLFVGALMLFVFGLGHGIPIIPISTFSRAARGKIGEKYIYLGGWMTKIFGAAVMVIGIVFMARYFGYYLW